MKKIYIVLFGILLIGLVTAGVLLTTDTSIDLSKEEKEALERVGTGIYDIEISKMTCDGETCKVNLYKSGAINTDIKISQYWTNCTRYNKTEESMCIEEETFYYSDEELLNLRDEKIKARLEQIANIKIEREQRTEEDKLGEGIVTIQEGISKP